MHQFDFGLGIFDFGLLQNLAIENASFPAIQNRNSKIQNQKRAGVAQLVERQPSKLNVAGSNPVSRSIMFYE